MAPTTESTPKSGAIQDAFADLQTPGVSIEFRGPGGNGAKIEDPMVAVLGPLCEIAEGDDAGATPWPYVEGDPVEFVRAEQAEEVGAGLILGLIRLAHLASYRIHYLYRYKDNWTSNGKTVLGQMKRPTGLLKNYAESDFIVLLNWKAWHVMTPMQRVALVYHELRHGDADGKVQAHQFEGFFDELQLFGTRTYRDWMALAEAVDRGERIEHQYSLELGAKP